MTGVWRVFYGGPGKETIEYHKQALAIANEIGDRRGEGRRLDNLGSAYATLNELPKAIEYYEKGLALSRVVGDREEEGIEMFNLGQAFYGLGQREKAIELTKAANEIFKQIESPYTERARKRLAEWEKGEETK